MSDDYYDENGVHSPEGYGQSPKSSRAPVLILAGALAGLVILSVAGVLLVRGEGGAPAATAGPPAAPSPSPSPLPTSVGVTQAQLDALGTSIGARYESGDNEVAQALLDDFMRVHPECVSAVMAGGEGRMREVLAESEKVAKYLLSTAPHPNSYTTIITVKQDDGTVKAAVLGVSCEEGQ